MWNISKENEISIFKEKTIGGWEREVLFVDYIYV